VKTAPDAMTIFGISEQILSSKNGSGLKKRIIRGQMRKYSQKLQKDKKIIDRFDKVARTLQYTNCKSQRSSRAKNK